MFCLFEPKQKGGINCSWLNLKIMINTGSPPALDDEIKRKLADINWQ